MILKCISEYIFFISISRYQHQQNNVNPVVKKVYFFWICPDTNAFEWFTDLLQYLEERVGYYFFAIISGNCEVINPCEEGVWTRSLDRRGRDWTVFKGVLSRFDACASFGITTNYLLKHIYEMTFLSVTPQIYQENEIRSTST